MGDDSFKISDTKTPANEPQLKPSGCFCTGRKLTISFPLSLTIFLYNASKDFFLVAEEFLQAATDLNPNIRAKSEQPVIRAIIQ